MQWRRQESVVRRLHIVIVAVGATGMGYIIKLLKVVALCTNRCSFHCYL